ncbi:MAG: TonB-dependent receptor [Chryseolinea sp.]
MKTFIQTSIRYCLSTILFSIMMSSVTGQSLEGKVQDHEGKSIPFVNLLLLNSNDSTLVKGAVTDADGIYTIDKVKPGTYVLAASMIGYKKTYLPGVTTAGQSVVTLPVITLEANATQLKEVSVTAQRPFVEQFIDRTVINVANSIIASGSTALEILEKSPGITVDRQNDDIQLRGQTGVIVQINGKQTYLAMADVVSMLRGTSSENIDKIELITNPSSKYDASGNSGIINIVMKKDTNLGTNGVLTLAGGSGRFDRERAGLQLNHNTRKINLTTTYSGTRGGSYFDLSTKRQFFDEKGGTFADQGSYLSIRELTHNLKVTADYRLGKRTTIGITGTGFWSSRKETGTANSSFMENESGPTYLMAATDKVLTNKLNNRLANFNLQHKFEGKGGQLTADVDWGYFGKHFTNLLITSTSFSGNDGNISALYTAMPATIEIQTYKTDYNRELTNDWKFEAGLKYSQVETNNDLHIYTGTDDNLQPDESLTNHFQYTERVAAGYFSFSGKLKSKTEIQIGLRAEHTHSLANSITTDFKVPRDYLNLFPTLYVSQPLSKVHMLTFSYGRRILRPNYQNLNTGRSYIDPYLYSQGNAFLRPQYTHSFEIKHGFRNAIFTSFGADFTDEEIATFIEPVDSLQSVRRPLNTGKTQFYNFEINFPITISNHWTLQTSILGTYSRFQYMFQDVPQRAEQFSARFNMSNAITLGNGWTAEASGWVSTPEVYAIYKSPWLGSLDMGIQKAITDKLKLKLMAQDVFHSNFVRSKISSPTFYRQTRLNFDTRVIMLTLTYSFGDQKLKGGRQRKGGSEDELKRTGN